MDDFTRENAGSEGIGGRVKGGDEKVNGEVPISRLPKLSLSESAFLLLELNGTEEEDKRTPLSRLRPLLASNRASFGVTEKLVVTTPCGVEGSVVAKVSASVRTEGILRGPNDPFKGVDVDSEPVKLFKLWEACRRRTSSSWVTDS